MTMTTSTTTGTGRRPGYTNVRPPAVAGAFYPADPDELAATIDRQLDYARKLLAGSATALIRHRADAFPDSADVVDAAAGQGVAGPTPTSWPKAIIVPHAGYVYSGTTAALAYALLARGKGTVTRAVIVGPTHRIGVRGVAMGTADAWLTPLGTVPVDVDAEQAVWGSPSRPASLIVNDPTHRDEHAVEVQVPFLQRVLGEDLRIVPMNAGTVAPGGCGDVLRAFWGGPETVVVISSDLSHYHPHAEARAIDDDTIAAINTLAVPIDSFRACGASPVNGLLDVLGHAAAGGLRLQHLGCATSGDDGVVTLAGGTRPPMRDPFEPVVGYSSWAVWERPAAGR